MLQSVRNFIERWRDAKAVEAMSERELAELGMRRDQVLNFLRMPPDTPDRVVAMARVFGLTAGEVKADHAEWLDLLETCSQCGDRGACALTLSKGDLAGPRDAEYCPNKSAFESHWLKA
ncbi:DUF6455 family protein [Thioclava sp. FR2]|uniref:DUF6455 family protein n=1 Tax=Thioclava sp. FR2 TaxID=3445780 RepID=UPI003EB8A017